MKQTICPSCGGSLKSLAIGWRCKKCKGFISYQDGKFYEYVEKPFIPPQTNADRIRAMSDEELASFMTDRNVNESTLLLLNKDNGLTDVQIEAIRHNIYCCLMQWLKQPAEGE